VYISNRIGNTVYVLSLYGTCNHNTLAFINHYLPIRLNTHSLFSLFFSYFTRAGTRRVTLCLARQVIARRHTWKKWPAAAAAARPPCQRCRRRLRHRRLRRRRLGRRFRTAPTRSRFQSRLVLSIIVYLVSPTSPTTNTKDSQSTTSFTSTSTIYQLLQRHYWRVHVDETGWSMIKY
jgi:uncharacterized paraquat-inducible protein A